MKDMAVEVRGEYKNWLFDIVDEYEYGKLLRFLHRTDFRWSHRMDENRAGDGEELRNRFLYEYSYLSYGLPDHGASVLETLIALSYRIDDILIKIEDDPNPHKWFWELMENLGLDRFDDVALDRNPEMWDELKDIVYDFMERKYDYNGDGGLFPLRKPEKDQREVEIWWQMQAYIREKEDR